MPLSVRDDKFIADFFYTTIQGLGRMSKAQGESIKTLATLIWWIAVVQTCINALFIAILYKSIRDLLLGG